MPLQRAAQRLGLRPSFEVAQAQAQVVLCTAKAQVLKNQFTTRRASVTEFRDGL